MNEPGSLFDASRSSVDPLDVLPSDQTAAVAVVARLAAGVGTQQDLCHIQRAARAWLESDGDLSFERCLRLPSTPDGFRRMNRDRWLCEAARHIQDASDWIGCTALEDAWDRFLSRGPWREWRDDPLPPAWAAPLDNALFFASRYNRGNSLSAKQIQRIAGHVFRSKCQ